MFSMLCFDVQVVIHRAIVGETYVSWVSICFGRMDGNLIHCLPGFPLDRIPLLIPLKRG